MGDNPIAFRSKKRLTEALDAIMRRKPYVDITITELCNEAGLSRPAFYQNFGRISDVLARLIREYIADAITEADFGTLGSAEDIANMCVGLVNHDEDFMALIADNQLARSYALELTDVLCHDERFVAGLGENADDRAQQMNAAFAAAGISVALAMWLEDKDGAAPEDVAQAIAQSLVGACAK